MTGVHIFIILVLYVKLESIALFFTFTYIDLLIGRNQSIYRNLWNEADHSVCNT